ncbi:MAG: hypothetical protein ACPGXY_05820 [Alphaproteobacteria bacterium]
MEPEIAAIVQDMAHQAFYSGRYQICRFLEDVTDTDTYKVILKYQKDGPYGNYAADPDFMHKASDLYSTFWLKNDNYGGRFAVTIYEFNWKAIITGLSWWKDFSEDIYRKHLGQEDMDHPDAIIPDECGGTDKNIVILQAKESGKIFAIVPSHFCHLADWDIMVPVGAGEIQKYTVSFMDSKKDSRKYIPAGAFHDISKVLDDMIGKPAERVQGTLRSIDTLRTELIQRLYNISLRPWVFDDDSPAESHCYNTVQEVDQGLQKWSRLHSVYAQQLKDYKELLPDAVTDLAKYYQDAFDYSVEESQKLAKRIMTIWYVSHFVFPKPRED